MCASLNHPPMAAGGAGGAACEAQNGQEVGLHMRNQR